MKAVKAAGVVTKAGTGFERGYVKTPLGMEWETRNAPLPLIPAEPVGSNGPTGPTGPVGPAAPVNWKKTETRDPKNKSRHLN